MTKNFILTFPSNVKNTLNLPIADCQRLGFQWNLHIKLVTHILGNSPQFGRGVTFTKSASVGRYRRVIIKRDLTKPVLKCDLGSIARDRKKAKRV